MNQLLRDGRSISPLFSMSKLRLRQMHAICSHLTNQLLKLIFTIPTEDQQECDFSQYTSQKVHLHVLD